MALTATQSTWLSRDNVRAILVEIEYYTGSPFLIYCNNGNTLYPASQPFLIYCNNGNTNPDYAKIYCNTTAIEGVDNSVAIHAANMPYITGTVTENDIAGNDLDNVAYVDILNNVPSINSSIDGSTSLGNVQILNETGDYDFVFDRDNYTFEGHEIKVLIGDPSWGRDDFIQVFKGIIDEVTTSSTNIINIAIRDRKDIFNKQNLFKTITESYVATVLLQATQFTDVLENFPRDDGGGGVTEAPLPYQPSTYSVPNGVENSPMPTALGKCYNVSPILIDAWNHVYLVNDGPVTTIENVRSNGLLLDAAQYEVDTNIGCFRLLDHNNATKITCDITGTTVRGSGYDATETGLVVHTIPWIIEWLILEHTQLTNSDIDYDSFDPTVAVDEFGYEVGIYFTDDETTSTLMTALTNSIGAFYRFNRDNKVQLTMLEDPDTLDPPTVTIDEDSIVRNSLSIQGIEIPNTEISLGYKKNWTTLSESEQAGILQEVESLETQQQLANEYTILKAYNTDLKVKYPLAESANLIETLIWDATDATDELTRRAGIRGELRQIFKVNSVLNPMDLSVGDTVTLKHNRFDLSAGKPMVILSMSEKLSSNRVDLELWR